MQIRRSAFAGTLLLGFTWLIGCGSDEGKKVEPPEEGGAAGQQATAGGDGNAPSEGGAKPGNDAGAPSTGAAGAPEPGGDGGTGAAGGSDGAAGNGGGIGTLTSCDEPLVVDDAPETSIAPSQPTIFQAPGGLTLLTWREAAYRKARVLGDDDTLGSVFTFPIIANSSDQVPHYVASGAGGLVYLDWERTSVTAYDAESDTWSPPDVHAGLNYPLVQFLANGDTLHVVTDAVGSVGSLQTRSAAGAWSAEIPLWSWGADKFSLPELMLDGNDDGALIAARQPNTFALVGWVIQDGKAVGEASVAVGSYLTSLDSALLPNGDVLAVYQNMNDAITRAATLSYDPDQGTASWSEPIELVQPASQISGLSIDSNGDATLFYGFGTTDALLRRIDGVWGDPTELSLSDRWWSDPLVDANDTVFMARALDEPRTLTIISSAAGESHWSAPIDVMGDFGWSFPQRPRMGLHASGHPMVIWQGTNPSGGSDILLSVCR